jgi:diadenylate cyclase
MAVIIRDDRVVAARVQLPLAEAESIDGLTLGSRHRAAIGITAGSDASCIVVSEETGIISIAQSGKLIRNITESQLRMHLSEIVGEKTPGEQLRRLHKKSNERPRQEEAKTT